MTPSDLPTPPVQELSAATILSGKSAVLAAETGSGKTMAYLAPLMSVLLNERDITSTPRGGH